MTYTDYLKTIGANMREMRKRAGLTQAQVAEKLNISTKHFSAIERGEENPSLKVLIDTAQLFHIQPEQLLHISSDNHEIHDILTKFSKCVDSALFEMRVELERAQILNSEKE